MLDPVTLLKNKIDARGSSIGPMRLQTTNGYEFSLPASVGIIVPEGTIIEVIAHLEKEVDRPMNATWARSEKEPWLTHLIVGTKVVATVQDDGSWMILSDRCWRSVGNREKAVQTVEEILATNKQYGYTLKLKRQ